MYFDFVTMASQSAANGGLFGKLFWPLYWFFGKCMEGLLFVFDNKYFLALIVFTILTRLVLFPFNLKQQKTMAKTNRIQPKIQKIQKKYNINAITDGRQRQKANQAMQEEMQALYAREGHNPMNMGCGPMAFQMVFLMGIIGIIYYPVEYILNIKISDYQDAVAKIINFKATGTNRYLQLDLIRNIADYKADLLANSSKVGGIFTEQSIAKIEAFKDGLNIFGIDMSQVPTWKGIIVIIPILCLVTSIASTLVSTLIQKKNNPAVSQQQSQMLLMMLMMPLFSFYISFKLPAAVGFYWVISNLVAIAQQLVMAKFFPPKRNIAREMVENTIYRRSREESIKKMKNSN
ncbi:MAG: YidC/Oxa1 family membrane protein insertase [Eubacterium sp.]|nr:YidC/Oxa1 family membrane protein insertase [Eubacterium sp.]MBQ8981334.1 YidC/Oxa1 family membrane protein insertase [Eubacterium sp.]MBR2278475.1 YidC/Oxa1 family membrane protein insertase [Eubacterium sp.]